MENSTFVVTMFGAIVDLAGASIGTMDAEATGKSIVVARWAKQARCVDLWGGTQTECNAYKEWLARVLGAHVYPKSNQAGSVSYVQASGRIKRDES